MRIFSLALFGLVTLTASFVLLLSLSAGHFQGSLGEMNHSLWQWMNVNTATPARIVPSNTQESATISSSTQAVTVLAPEPQGTGGYFQYKTGVLGNGETLLLFFTGTPCALCTSIDTELKALYRTGTLSVSTYRVNVAQFPTLVSRFSASAGSLMLVSSSGSFLSSIPLSESGSLIGSMKEVLK